MRIITTSGLLLFIVGFLLFNTMFFWSDYTLTPEIVRQRIKEENRQAAFLQAATPLLNHPVNTNFRFVAALTATFERANSRLAATYGVTANDVDRILRATADGFNLATIDNVFPGHDAAARFKRKAFRDFGGSLDGKPVTKDQLAEVAGHINRYAVPNEFGFDRYRVNDLTFALTKAATQGALKEHPAFYLTLTLGLCILGALMYILPKRRLPPGIKNNGIYFNAMKNTGWLGILTGSWLILFYVLLYFYPEYMTNWVMLADPVSKMLNGGEAGRFFLYGLIYTFCILVMGVRMLIHYRHSRYQVFRTLSVMFFQTSFAFLIPEILIRLHKPYFDFKNIWPLDYDFFFGSELNKLIESGTLGLFMLGWGIALVIVAVPVFTYFFGKRWYCSWVCGCGGLAETLGDPYRQLSSKSLRAWQMERWMVHGVLVLAVVMTAAVLYTYWTGASWFLVVDSYQLRSAYGFLIGAGFAGVVGTGFYPFMGSRVWCRFGCPLAAYLGLVQRFRSRFRITTNGGQCISCGNCSTYCEMGIDVRWYAQRGQNIVRASCVGCGICSAVCPRGVLNLETKDEKGRFGKPILIGNNNVKVAE